MGDRESASVLAELDVLKLAGNKPSSTRHQMIDESRNNSQHKAVSSHP